MPTQPQSFRQGEPDSKIVRSNWRNLYLVSGAAALSIGIILLDAILDLIRSVIQPGSTNGWLSLFQNNWLIVIFKLQAGFDGIHPDLLFQLNLVDMVLLVLVSISFISLYLTLKSTSRIWSFIALVQPFLAILLFIVTKTAGRCGVMGAVLVISIVMLRNKFFAKPIAFVGILSSVLLLSGDFGVELAPSNILAILMGIGYVLLTTWFFLIGWKLFQLRKPTRAV